MRPDPSALMIFAAGFGRRMGALTADRPKPLVALAGRTLLDRAIATGTDAGLSHMVVNTHHLAAQIETALEGRGIAISREEPDILDTGGGLAAARGLLKSDIVYTINPDALFLGPNPLRQLAAAWPASTAAALLLVVPCEKAEMRQGGGDFSLGADGRLTRGGPLVYTGAQIVDTSRLSEVEGPAFSLNSYWDLLAGEGLLAGAVYPDRWCDLGTPEALAHAETLIGDTERA